MLETVLFREATDDQRRRLLDLATDHAEPADEPITAPAGEVPAHVLRLVGDQEHIPFQQMTLLVVADALHELHARLASHRASTDVQAVLGQAIRAAMARSQQSLLRCQTQLMANRAGTIPGATSQERYQHFAQWLCTQQGLAEFAETFPVAVRDARRRVCELGDELIEILVRFEHDRAALSPIGVDAGSTIVSVELGAGDIHDGRTVALLTFSDGTRAVYKPRPLAIDAGYAHLVDRIHRAGLRTSLRAAAVVDRGAYGWVEFIPTEPVRDAAVAHRNVGELLAMLHTLRATDMHYENIIMRGDTPVPIDIETLLAAVPPADGDRSAPGIVALSQRVSFVGLLPSQLSIPGQEADWGALDVGALGEASPQPSPFTSLVLHEPFTDRMHFTLERLPARTESLLPPLPVDDVIDEVTVGYTAFMRWALQNKAWLIDHIRDLFRGCEVRFVPLNTQRYAQVLRLATHPELQHDHASRDLALWRIGLFRDDVPNELIVAEHEQMRRGHVPRFTFRTDRRDIQSSAGLIVRDALEDAPVEHVIGQLGALDTDQVELDAWVMQLSFSSRLSQRSGHSAFEFEGPTQEQGNTDVEGIIEELAVGIARSSVTGGHGHPPTWIGGRPSVTAFQYWVVDELPLELYSGSVGNALNLVHAGSVIGSNHWTSLTRRFFDGTAAVLARPDMRWDSLPRGAHVGVESFLWAAGEAARVNGDSAAQQRVTDLWARAVTTFPVQESEVLGGTAGVILALASAAADDPTGTRSQLCDEFGRAVIGEAMRHRRPVAYSGFAHGAAGVYAALCRWRGLTGRTDGDDLIREVLALEGAFAADDGAVRFGEEGTGEGRGWCHGSPGRLLARALVLRDAPDLVDPALLRIDALVRQVRSDCFGGNLSLCHGDLGNLWVLEDVASIVGDAELGAAVSSAAARYIDHCLPRVLAERNRHTIVDSLMVGRGGALAYLSKRRGAGWRSPLWLG